MPQMLLMVQGMQVGGQVGPFTLFAVLQVRLHVPLLQVSRDSCGVEVGLQSGRTSCCAMVPECTSLIYNLASPPPSLNALQPLSSLAQRWNDPILLDIG